MKPLVLIAVTFISLYTSGQQLTTEIQSRKGVFTEQLYLKDRWVNHITTDLNSADSANDNVLATGRAIVNFARLKAGNPIQNQFSGWQPASFRIQGTGTIGALPGYRSLLAGALPAQLNITQNGMQHGLSVQQANYNTGFANIELFKNTSTSFNTLQALQPGDSIGSIIFSGVAGDNNTIVNAMSMHGLVEKTAPAYLSSGFVFNAVDINGQFAQRMWLNGQGNLLLGNDTANSYSLNVPVGDIRINSLSGDSNVLIGADNDGVLKKIKLSENLYFADGMLNVKSTGPGFRTYLAIMTQEGQDAPSGYTFEGGIGDIQWARVSTGVYTGTLEGAFAPGYTFFKTEASDMNGNAAFVKMYRSGPDTVTMIVKDAAQNNIDNWTGISIEIKEYEQN